MTPVEGEGGDAQASIRKFEEIPKVGAELLRLMRRPETGKCGGSKSASVSVSRRVKWFSLSGRAAKVHF